MLETSWTESNDYQSSWIRQVELINYNHHQLWDFVSCYVDSHHYHHGQKPTMVGICHGGNKLGNLYDDYLMTIRWLSVIWWLSDDYPMTIQWLSNDYHKLLIYCLSPVQHSSLDDLVQKHFNCKFLRVDLYLVVFWFYSKVFSVQILRVDGSCMRGDGSDKRQQHSHTTTLLLWWSSQKWKIKIQIYRVLSY